MEMNAKLLVVALACALAVAVAEAGRIENKEELEGAKSAFNNNLNFFANLIKKNEDDAHKQATIKDAFKSKRDSFQSAIDANKGAPIPRPMEKEVDVYLHDAEEPAEAEAETAPEAHGEDNLQLDGLFSQ